jgi:hypothetical protein
VRLDVLLQVLSVLEKSRGAGRVRAHPELRVGKRRGQHFARLEREKRETDLSVRLVLIILELGKPLSELGDLGAVLQFPS